jgi:hypothetical protein
LLSKSWTWVKSNPWIALVIAVLFLAAAGSALDSCHRAGKLAEAKAETEAIAEAAKAGDDRHAAEMTEIRNRLAVAEAREAASSARLESARRAAAAPWARPRGAGDMVDRFRTLGYRGVCR